MVAPPCNRQLIYRQRPRAAAAIGLPTDRPTNPPTTSPHELHHLSIFPTSNQPTPPTPTAHPHLSKNPHAKHRPHATRSGVRIEPKKPTFALQLQQTSVVPSSSSSSSRQQPHETSRTRYCTLLCRCCRRASERARQSKTAICPARRYRLLLPHCLWAGGVPVSEDALVYVCFAIRCCKNQVLTPGDPTSQMHLPEACLVRPSAGK